MTNAQEGICLIILAALLAICYFAPNYIEGFTNTNLEPYSNLKDKNNQSTTTGSIQFNGIDSTYNIKGPVQSLNLTTGVGGQFPFYARDPSNPYNQKIQMITQGGSIVNGYSHSIIRPLDNVSIPNNENQCKSPCYTSSKYQTWCNPKDAINYYGMRPLVTPTNYNGWLTNLFNVITKPKNDVSLMMGSNLQQKIFCGKDEQSYVMQFIMEEIAKAIPTIPQLKNNGPWGVEQFHYTDTQFYSFKADNGAGTVYKIIFNLYNPLRSTSTMTETVVINPQDKGILSIAKIGFVNQGDWKLDNTETSLKGFNLLPPKGSINLSDISDQTHYEGFDWNYGNTLEIQKFNEFGFFDSNRNIEIKGGVPESLKPALNSCKNSMLLSCSDIKFNGINSECKQITPNHEPQLVNDTPTLVYQNFGKINSNTNNYIHSLPPQQSLAKTNNIQTIIH